MADSIFKQHRLDIPVGVKLNETQAKANVAVIKKMASQWQDTIDDAIKNGLEDGIKDASLKDVLNQFNAQLKAFKLDPLTITIDELKVLDKPIEHAANLTLQKFASVFKGGGLGDIIGSEISSSLDVLSGTVDKIYQKMEQGAKKSASNIAKSMAEIEKAAGKVSKGDMKRISGAISSTTGVSSDSVKAKRTFNDLYSTSKTTSESDASWVEKYSADVKFVRAFQRLNEKQKTEIYGDNLADVQAYYTKLEAIHEEKMIALNNILAQNDYVKKGKNPIQYQFKGGEPWAREKTLQEVKTILSGGLTVKNDGGGNENSDLKPKNLNTPKPETTPPQKDGSPNKHDIKPPKPVSSTPDISAYNQKLFDAIDKLGDDISASFKSLINEEMTEDEHDDKVVELVSEFTKQFKFNNKQHINDDLVERADNMGDWSSKKIYDKLSKKLSPDDPSWPRIEAPIVDDANIRNTHDNIQIILKDMNEFLSSNKDKKIRDYFEWIADGSYEMSDDVKSAIEATIGDISKLSSIDIGANNFGGLVGEKSALILRKPGQDINKKNDDAIELRNRLGDTNVSDVNLGRIQEVIKAEEYLAELQNRVSGTPISTIGESIEAINPDVLNTTTTSIQSLIQAMRELYNVGVEVDVENLGNILYDGQSDQFGIVDMDVHKEQASSFKSFEEMLTAFAQTVRNQVEDIADTLNDPKLAQAWSRFADMVDGEVEKSKSLLPTTDGNDGVLVDTKTKSDTTKRSDGSTEVKASIDTEELKGLLNSITYNVKVVQDVDDTPAPTETKGQQVSIDEESLRNVLNSITHNVKVVSDDSNADAKKVAIDEIALENVLNKVLASKNTQQNDNNSWALENTLQLVKGVLDQIQTNTAKVENTQLAVIETEVVPATENTLLLIKTAVEAINNKITQGAGGGSGKKDTSAAPGTGIVPVSTDNKSSESLLLKEKIQTASMALVKYTSDLYKTGMLYGQTEKVVKSLWEAMKKLKLSPDQEGLSLWNQHFQQIQKTVGVVKNLGDKYKELGKWEAILEHSEAGSNAAQNAQDNIDRINAEISAQKKLADAYEDELESIREISKEKEKQGLLTKNAKKEDAKASRDNKRSIEQDIKDAQDQARVGRSKSVLSRATDAYYNTIPIDGLTQTQISGLEDYKTKIEDLRRSLSDIKNSDGPITDEQQKELIEQTRQVDILTKEYQELLSEYNKLSGDNAKTIGTNTAINPNDINAYQQQLVKAVEAETGGKATIKGFDADTKTLTYTLKTGAHEITTYTAAVRRLDGSIVSVQGSTKKLPTFLDGIKKKMREISQYFSAMSLISRLGQELRQGIQYVREIDLALTELKKVTDETEETYDKFLETASKTATKVGSTIKDVISSTADWARLNI